ncbi:MAG TPA: hypothetical protein PLC53_02695 [Bacilli bacterium]|nr:hypothetical protein [Bacilli bacterium]
MGKYEYFTPKGKAVVFNSKYGATGSGYNILAKSLVDKYFLDTRMISIIANFLIGDPTITKYISETFATFFKLGREQKIKDYDIKKLIYSYMESKICPTLSEIREKLEILKLNGESDLWKALTQKNIFRKDVSISILKILISFIKQGRGILNVYEINELIGMDITLKETELLRKIGICFNFNKNCSDILTFPRILGSDISPGSLYALFMHMKKTSDGNVNLQRAALIVDSDTSFAIIDGIMSEMYNLNPRENLNIIYDTKKKLR